MTSPARNDSYHSLPKNGYERISTRSFSFRNRKLKKSRDIPKVGIHLFLNDELIGCIGNDMQLDSGVGTCGKEGQSVPVGVGQPTLKIDEMPPMTIAPTPMYRIFVDQSVQAPSTGSAACSIP